MNEHLRLGFCVTNQCVRIRIAGEQDELKKQQRRGPYRSRSAEPGQNDFRDQGLHLKQQERAQEDGNGVDGHLRFGVDSCNRRSSREFPRAPEKRHSRAEGDGRRCGRRAKAKPRSTKNKKSSASASSYTTWAVQPSSEIRLDPEAQKHAEDRRGVQPGTKPANFRPAFSLHDR